MSATWIKSIYCQMSQKWWFDPKWRIKIRFFVLTLRESKIFSIFFLHSFGVSKTQILWETKFFKKSKMAAQTIFSVPAILDFLKNFVSHKICVLLRPNESKKKTEKILDTLRVTSKNLILIRHFGSNRNFWLILQ
jgi:hypothetical protein